MELGSKQTHCFGPCSAESQVTNALRQPKRLIVRKVLFAVAWGIDAAFAEIFNSCRVYKNGPLLFELGWALSRNCIISA